MRLCINTIKLLLIPYVATSKCNVLFLLLFALSLIDTRIKKATWYLFGEHKYAYMYVVLGTGWLSQYGTWYWLCCGKNWSVYLTAAVYWPSEASTPSEDNRPSVRVARPVAPPWAPMEALPEGKIYAFSLHFPSQSVLKTVLAKDGCVHLHRKKQKVKKNTSNVWRWYDVHVVGFCAGWCIINRCDV